MILVRIVVVQVLCLKMIFQHVEDVMVQVEYMLNKIRCLVELELKRLVQNVVVGKLSISVCGTGKMRR